MRKLSRTEEESAKIRDVFYSMAICGLGAYVSLLADAGYEEKFGRHYTLQDIYSLALLNPYFRPREEPQKHVTARIECNHIAHDFNGNTRMYMQSRGHNFTKRQLMTVDNICEALRERSFSLSFNPSYDEIVRRAEMEAKTYKVSADGISP